MSYLSDLQVGFSIQVGGLSVTHGLWLAVEKMHQNMLKMINPIIVRKSVSNNSNNQLRNCLFNNNFINIIIITYLLFKNKYLLPLHDDGIAMNAFEV